MPFVVDASVAASWFLPEDRPMQAEATYALLTDDYAMAPNLWWYEMRNLFVTNERRGRIDRGRTDQALSLLARLSIRLDGEPIEGALLELARRHQLTVYDAAYLELAQRKNFSLATLDRALASAARAEGVSLIGD